MRCVDGVELGAECGEGGIAELRDQPARQVTRQARAVLRAGERGPVDVGLAVAHALEEALLVELDDEMAVPRDIQRTARPLPSFDDTRQGEHLELSFGVPLLDARPHRGALRGLLAERKRVEESQPPRIGESLESLRSAFVLFVAPTLEQGRIARKEVELEVFDGHPLTARLVYDRRVVGFPAPHTTPMSYVFERSLCGCRRGGMRQHWRRISSAR